MSLIEIGISFKIIIKHQIPESNKLWLFYNAYIFSKIEVYGQAST